MACPICGQPDGACTGDAGYFDPVDMRELAPEDNIVVKGNESEKFRYPEQHVRAGRGVPGYTGSVEVIPTKDSPKSVKRVNGQTKAKQAPAEDK
jgi:hypothetical protein